MKPNLLKRIAEFFNNNEVHVEPHGDDASASAQSRNALMSMAAVVLMGATLAMSGQSMAADVSDSNERFTITNMQLDKAGVIQSVEYQGEAPSVDQCKPFAGMTLDGARAYAENYADRKGVDPFTAASMKYWVTDMTRFCNDVVLPEAMGQDMAGGPGMSGM